MAYLVQQPSASSSFPVIRSATQRRGVPDNDDDLYREAVNFSDVERLLHADTKKSGFKRIAQDVACSISLYSRPVEESPIHLMRAEVGLPCRAEEVLAYLNVSTRRQWDDYIAELRNVRILPRPLDASADSSVVDVDKVTELQLKPGQRRVGLYYMAIRTPIPLVQNRDFEMVVAEEARQDGTVLVKAFSTPLGYIEPLDPRQSKYVRALMLFSGILVKPMVSGKGGVGCHVSYVALVHPMGLIPSVVVNVVLGAQLNALKRLQKFILQHPSSTLSTKTTSMEKNSSTGGGGVGLEAEPIVERNASTPVTDGVFKNEVGKLSGNKTKKAEGRTRRMASSLRQRLASLKASVIDKLTSRL